MRACHTASAAQISAHLQEAVSACRDSPSHPLGPLTLLSLGPTGQAVGSSRLRSSPSRMEEDLSEFREKASVSASCTCRERWPLHVTPEAGMGPAWSSRKTQADGQRCRDLPVRTPCHHAQGPSLGRGRGQHEGVTVGTVPGPCWVAGGYELQSWPTGPQMQSPLKAEQ